MAKQNFEYDVFLSYSHQDKEIVHKLAKRMKKDGMSVWLDIWEIEPGDPISMKIQHGVEKSRTMVMCMSPDYFKSEWGRLEHHSMLFRDPTNAQRRFLPLLIRDCQLPDIIAQFAYIDWRTSDDELYNKLVGSCRQENKETKTPLKEDTPVDQTSMILKGHESDIYCLDITPDGKTVVSGADSDVKIWDVETGKCRSTLQGHSNQVRGVSITPDGKKIASSSYDSKLNIWSLETSQLLDTLQGVYDNHWGNTISNDGRLIAAAAPGNTLGVWDLETKNTYNLEGHTKQISRVAFSSDGQTMVSSSYDATLKVWDTHSQKCLSTLEGHTKSVFGVAITPDDKFVLSSSTDNTLKLWDLKTGLCRATFEGHTGGVYCLAITPDGKRAVSGSEDTTLKLWDIATGRCIATMEGHTRVIWDVVVTPDGRNVVSCSSDRTLRVWNLPAQETIAEDIDAARYTNAKVVLVGESGAGKTGLALRLAEDRWQETESTHGMNVWPLKLPGLETADMEREVWLWDLAGQPDYRLIHQLYMDETALGVLVFDPQDDNPFENIGYWNKALSAATKYNPAKLLVAGRCDRGGITISQRHFEDFVKEHDIADFLITGAKIGEGCEELKAAITKHIPWERLHWTATTRLFKTLKDAIIKLTEQDTPLARLSELRQRLQLSLPQETINDSDLRAVVGLIQGQGVIQMLGFGDFVLLQPEWINRYASVMVRMAREHADEMGVVPEQQVLDGRLDYKDMQRLDEADEKILLRAMVQILLDRSLCIREQTTKGTMLVFPSYFRRDKPDQPKHPNVFVTYEFSGPLDDIYSTLVVRLNYSNIFKKDQLWKDAADFMTPEGKLVGLAMTKKPEGAAKIVVYFEADTPDDTKVTFIKYVHEHLLTKAQPRESVTRLRTYICPDCQRPLENSQAIQIRLELKKEDIGCDFCDCRVPLFDLIENKFASDKFTQRVREIDQQAGINLDNEGKELILVGHSMAIAGEAGQIYRIVEQPEWGIDAEIEFKNSKAEASGTRVYLQLKSGDSYTYKRQDDNTEIFTIRKKSWAEHWLSQAYPVMLVIRSSDGQILWMNITEYLQQHGVNTKEIVFEGQAFTAANVALMRNRMLSDEPN